MNTITFSGKTYSFPAGWQECDKDQLNVILELLFLHTLPEPAFRISLALNLLLLQDTRAVRQYWQLESYALHEQKMENGHFYQDTFLNCKTELDVAAEALDWVLEPPTLTAPPYPDLCRGRYRCVRPGLTDMSYIVYVQADQAVRNYHHAASDPEREEALLQLMCALYAPVSSKGARQVIPEDDRRAQEKQRKDLAQCPVMVKLANMVFFESCSLALQEEFPMVFSSAGEPDTGEARFGPIGLIIEVAGGKFGDVDRTAEANLYTLLTYLEKEAIKYDEIKRKYGK